MKKTTPKISVIIPVFNTQDYLKTCLDSVFKQTFQDFEVICVDDGSTDDSLKILEEYKEKDSRLTVISQPNSKQGTARNKGLDLAKGVYIAFLDSDDFIPDDFLEILYNKAEETDSEVVLTDEVLYFQNTGAYSSSWRDLTKLKNIKHIDNSNFKSSFSGPPTCFYKKSYIDKNGLRFAENIFYEDNAWGCFRILFAKSVSFASAKYVYRQHKTSTTFVTDERVFDLVDDFVYFMDFIKNKTYDEKLLKLCFKWYLFNFQYYLFKLNDNLRRLFYKKLLDVLPLLKLDAFEILFTSDLTKDQSINMVLFYNFLCLNRYRLEHGLQIFDVNDFVYNRAKYNVLLLGAVSVFNRTMHNS